MPSRLLSSGLLFCALGACTPGIGSGTGGAGGQSTSTSTTTSTTSSGNTTSTTGATSSSSGMPMCATGCVDGNPCTDGSCVQGTCSQAAKPVGDPGNASEGGCTGVCQADGQCGLSLYTRNFPAPSTWSKQALSAAWTGANAAPPRGILAAEHEYQQDKLFVWADDGMVYRRESGTWLAPVATSTLFPGLGASNVRSTAMWQPNAGSQTHSLLVSTTGTTPRQAFAYDVSGTDVVTPSPGNPVSIGSAVSKGGPPQDTTDIDWSFPVQTAYLGTADWVIFWQHAGTKVYEYNGANDTYMGSWDDASSPLWMGGGTPPAPQSVVATFYYQGSVYMIAP